VTDYGDRASFRDPVEVDQLAGLICGWIEPKSSPQG
jgi:hypothetical protein